VKKYVFNRGLTLERAYNWARNTRFIRAISVFTSRGRKRLLNRLTLSYDDIDWKQTKAFAVGTGGHIYLNVKGREPQGIVEPGKEYEKVRNYIIERLESLIDPETGKKVIERVFVKEELFKGKFFNNAPDISLLPSKNYATLHQQQFVSPSLFINSPISGTHAINGILIFYGPGIQKDKQIKGAKIYDLAPTILHVFGLPIPNDMDGRVLMEIFEEDSEFANRKPKYVDPDYYEKKIENEKLKKAIKNLKLKGKI